jgi:predicted N-acetyltransferase YhbS
MLTIRDEIPADGLAREVLLDACFGTARFEKTSERLREDRLPARGLALSAVLGGEPVGAGADDIVGTVRLWNVSAGSAGEGLLLGPLAVDAAHRSLGIGARLMREALWRAARLGHRFVLLVGDAPYYARFGFEPAPAGLDLPGPVDRARFLAFEIRPGALSGARGLVTPTGRKMSQRSTFEALPLEALPLAA